MQKSSKNKPIYRPFWENILNLVRETYLKYCLSHSLNFQFKGIYKPCCTIFVKSRLNLVKSLILITLRGMRISLVKVPFNLI